MILRAALAALCLGTALHAATPAEAAPVEIVTDAEDAQTKQAVLRDVFHDVTSYFEQRHGLVPDQPMVLVGTDAPDTIDTLLAQGLRLLGRPPRAKPTDTDRLCANRRIGAAANRDYIIMCWRRPARYDVAWRGKTARIMAHELTHHMQYQLARDRPARRDVALNDWVLGPGWMVEGAAEVIETDYQTPLSGLTPKDIYDLQNRARRSRVTLSDLTESGSVKGSAAYAVSRFACLMLARKHGVGALFAYFTALGDLGERDKAFEQIFGQSFEAFEQEFEVLRRDFGAARDYGRNGS